MAAFVAERPSLKSWPITGSVILRCLILSSFPQVDNPVTLPSPDTFSASDDDSATKVPNHQFLQHRNKRRKRIFLRSWFAQLRYHLWSYCLASLSLWHSAIGLAPSTARIWASRASLFAPIATPSPSTSKIKVHYLFCFIKECITSN